MILLYKKLAIDPLSSFETRSLAMYSVYMSRVSVNYPWPDKFTQDKLAFNTLSTLLFLYENTTIMT